MALPTGKRSVLNKKLQMIALCVIALLLVGYFLSHLVPGSPDFSDIASVALGLVSLSWAVRIGDKLDQEPDHPATVEPVVKLYAPMSGLRVVTPSFQRDPLLAIRVRAATSKLPRPRPEATA